MESRWNDKGEPEVKETRGSVKAGEVMEIGNGVKEEESHEVRGMGNMSSSRGTVESRTLKSGRPGGQSRLGKSQRLEMESRGS